MWLFPDPDTQDQTDSATSSLTALELLQVWSPRGSGLEVGQSRTLSLTAKEIGRKGLECSTKIFSKGGVSEGLERSQEDYANYTPSTGRKLKKEKKMDKHTTRIYNWIYSLQFFLSAFPCMV